MKWIMLLILTNICYGQENLSIIGLKPNEAIPEEVSTPTVIVDIFGNTNWKYPQNYFDPPKKIEKPLKAKAEVLKKLDFPKYRPFEKGDNIQHSIYTHFAIFGALQGLELGYSYSSNYISHGFEYKNYKSETYQVSLTTQVIMTNYKFEYHAFPMWYVNNKSFKTFDAGLLGTVGQVQSTTSDGAIVGTAMFVGFGGFLKYPISEHIKLKINVEFNEPFHKSIEMGAAGSLGLSFDF